MIHTNRDGNFMSYGEYGGGEGYPADMSGLDVTERGVEPSEFDAS